MTYRVIDKCEFSLLCGFVNDYELIAPVQKAGAMFLVWLPALCALGARGDNPPAMRVDGNILIKPPSRGILMIVQAVKIRREGGGYGPEGLQPVAYEVECKF